MKSFFAAALGLAAVAAAQSGGPMMSNNGTALPTNTNAVTVTEVVESFTTYCPYATTLATNGVTYTVTVPGYVTITTCPCTLTKPMPAGGNGGNGGKGGPGPVTPAPVPVTPGNKNGTSTGPAVATYTGAAVKGAVPALAAGAAILAFAL